MLWSLLLPGVTKHRQCTHCGCRWYQCEADCAAAWAAWRGHVIGGLAASLTEHCLTTMPATALRNRDRATRALALFQGAPLLDICVVETFCTG